MTAPPSGLYAAALHVLRSAHPQTHTLRTTLEDFTKESFAAHAAHLPSVLGDTLWALRSEPDQLRFAADLLVELDMYEAASAVTRVAWETGDMQLLFAAASLCGNPAADAWLRRRLAQDLADHPEAQIRLYDTHRPSTPEESLLFEQCWPGSRAAEDRYRLPPVAVLDVSFPPLDLLRVSLPLIDAGATVRRLDPRAEIPNWFGAQSAVVCTPETRRQIVGRYRSFPEDRFIEGLDASTDTKIAALLRRITNALPGTRSLRLSALGDELDKTWWDPDVYELGAYETSEVACLTSASSSILYSLARQEILKPLRHGRQALWQFRDVVAVRTWRYLCSKSQRRVPRDTIGELAKFAGDADATNVGVTSNGDLLAERDGHWVNVSTNDRVLPINLTEVDEAFEPFPLGSRQVPGLLQPSEHTTLHPTKLSGAPRLVGHRITARALHELDQQGGNDSILEAYPELQDIPFRDVVTIGARLEHGW